MEIFGKKLTIINGVVNIVKILNLYIIPLSTHLQWPSQDFTLGGADFKFLNEISQNLWK